MIGFCKLVIYFIIYSFIGWILEVIYCLFTEKKLINRGFLIGPICPIYGCGVLLIVLLINGDFSDLLSIFLKSILICSILEYFTSYIMEKLFGARWWDYSNRKYNINGRICLETMLPFGILGSLVVLFIHPFFSNIVSIFSNNLILILGISLFVILLTDIFISFNVMSKIKDEITSHYVDSTETIRKKVTKWLTHNSALFKRIFNAFPKFRIIKRVKERIVK